MSAALPPTIAVVLPPREGFGPRRARGIGLTVRHHEMATTGYRTNVFGGRQSGPVFLDVSFRLVRAPFFVPATLRARYTLGLIPALRRLQPVLIEGHAEPTVALWLQRVFPAIPVALVLYDDPAGSRVTRSAARRQALFARTARVLTVSNWLSERVLDGIDPSPGRPPIVIPPGVDFSHLPDSVAGLEAAGTALAKRRTRVILFVGRLTAEKGADQFIAACTATLPFLPAWRAEIIGAAEHTPNSPETEFTRRLHTTADPAGIGMMGYRDHPDVMAAMARAAIVVVPGSEPEPSGRVVLEAMANGAAVICTREGALPEIGGDAVVYAAPEELPAAIRALGSDPARLAALGQAGRARAALFDLPRIGQQMDAIRARIIADGPPRL